MVLIIKSSGDSAADVRLIATQMINIESNQTIYGKSGEVLSARRAKVPFNAYTHDSVDFEFQFTYGVIVAYCTQGIFPDELQIQLDMLGVPSTFTETIGSGTDQYTLVKEPIIRHNTRIGASSARNPCFRSIVCDGYTIKKALTTPGTNFMWHLVVKASASFRGPYLHIDEMDPTLLPEGYLTKSVCTIIYDGIDMFAAPTMIKQLDYPDLSQYNMFQANQIVREPIYVSWTGGLHFELYYQFTKSHPGAYLCAPPDIFREGIVSSEQLCLKRLDADRPYMEQLSEPFNYEKQEEDELLDEGKPPFLDDVCFITKIPIYQDFYIGTIKNATHEFDIALCPAVVHLAHVFGKREVHLAEYIKAHNAELSLIRLRRSVHHRSFLEVLDMLDIDPVKKNIMRCMELYGAYSDDMDVGDQGGPYRASNSRQYYVVDKTTDQIYLGLSRINDLHVAMYQNTPTILFRVIDVDKVHSPDPIIFRDLLIEE